MSAKTLHHINDIEVAEREKLRAAIDHSRRVRQRRTRLNSQRMAFERLADEQLSLAADWNKQAKQREQTREAATRIMEACTKGTPSDNAIIARAADINAVCDAAPVFDEHARRASAFAERAATLQIDLEIGDIHDLMPSVGPFPLRPDDPEVDDLSRRLYDVVEKQVEPRREAEDLQICIETSLQHLPGPQQRISEQRVLPDYWEYPPTYAFKKKWWRPSAVLVPEPAVLKSVSEQEEIDASPSADASTADTPSPTDTLTVDTTGAARCCRRAVDASPMAAAQ